MLQELRDLQCEIANSIEDENIILQPGTCRTSVLRDLFMLYHGYVGEVDVSTQSLVPWIALLIFNDDTEAANRFIHGEEEATGVYKYRGHLLRLLRLTAARKDLNSLRTTNNTTRDEGVGSDEGSIEKHGDKATGGFVFEEVARMKVS